MGKITTRTIVDLLTNDMEEVEIIFDTLLKIKTTPHHHLMDIAGVGVDCNDRLWAKDGRQNWVEIHDRLMYKDCILESLYQRLKPMLKTSI